MRRAAAIAAVAVAAIVTAPTARAYLRLGNTVNGKQVIVRWTSMPVRYLVTNRDVAGVTAGQLQTAVQQGFTAWSKVPAVTLSAEFVGLTSVEPFTDDGVNVIGFRARPDLDRTLGATTFEFDAVNGDLRSADIFLNSTFDWSVASAGDSTRFDVQSIMTHEIGHLLGLGHSALGETDIRPTGGRRVLAKQAIMFPIAFPAGNVDDRTPKPDDAAGLGDAYSSAAFTRQFGQVTGRVTVNGRGIFGAHVTAFNSTTGDLVSGFCLDAKGSFVIGGLKPGVYVVRAEPLDDGDVSSFFGSDTTVDINFKPAYFASLVAVPAGGSSVSIEIKAAAK